MKRILIKELCVLTIFVFVYPFVALADAVGEIDSLSFFHRSTAMNSGSVSQEMIYLHLDNTSYYRGDRIYFACYLVTAEHLAPSDLSKTVYVELLNPSGKIIDRCVLKSENGRCHGSLLADEAPFYSGYYEIRAYTRYMLNFGKEAIFTRTLPIFKAPKTEGDWSERSMLRYGARKLAFNREKPEKMHKVNASFFPEGGHLVNGLKTVVGFEVCDERQRPLSAKGKIINRKTKQTVLSFESGCMGRGVFSFTPDCNVNYCAEITAAGDTHSFELPQIEREGICLNVDNFGKTDSISIGVVRTGGFKNIYVGLSLTCRGSLYSRAIFDLSKEHSSVHSIKRSVLPTGVIQATLFDKDGNILADRLFFNNKSDFSSIDYEFSKQCYAPCELINLTVKQPHPAPFSISVTDAAHMVKYGSNILADLLLASEIKGYVHNPSWYFEDVSDSERQKSLDNLLLIQGWRKYSWRHLAGLEQDEIEFLPEQGVEVHGQVMHPSRNQPKGNCEVSVMLQDSEFRSIEDVVSDSFATDSLGYFSFCTDLQGTWLMLLSSVENGKVTNSRIMLNRHRVPHARQYDVGELHWEADNAVAKAGMDSIAPAADVRVEELPGVRLLKEVTITGKRDERKITRYRNSSVASYDIEAQYDEMLDNGKKHVRTLSDMLPLIDRNFRNPRNMVYCNKPPLYVLNYDEILNFDIEGVNAMLEFPLEAIQKVYVNTTIDAITEWGCKFAGEQDLKTKMNIGRQFGCVVFIEMYADQRVNLDKGMRRTPLRGYSKIEEFYSPDYSNGVPDQYDFRRTLYWNPDVNPDENGIANLQFYNNSTAGKLNVTVTSMPSNFFNE